MRCSVSFVAFIVAVTATSAQSQNFGQGQNFPQTPFQNFNNQGQNLGTTNIQLFNQYEENHLQAHKYFYFDMDLLKEICFKEKEGNILISPLSIKSILAMLLEGANGATAKELQMALHLPSNPSNQRVRYQFERLFTEIKRPTEGVHLQIANGIFIAKKYTVLAEFKNIVNQYYSADVKEVNFTNPVQSTNTINKWVNDNTNGIIPKIVEDGSLGNVPILLANALYFKGTWERAFSELGTKVSCFFLPNNECQMSPMMDVIDNFKFAELKELSAKLVELPYAGRAYSMVIVLPNDRNGIELLSRDITKLSFNEVLETLNETEVFVTLPRFKISYDVDLVNYLPGVHISRIFNSDAELNGVVADVNTRVSNMLHKAYVEVNEQGTVAAAATGAVVIPLMVNTKPRIKADHPFLFFIRHVSTGTILFEGRVSVPERSYGQPNHQQTQQQNIPQRPVQQSTVNRQQPLPSQRPVPQQPVDNIYNQFMGSTQPEYSFQNPQPQQPSSYENTPQQQDVLFQSPLPVNYNPQTQPFPAQNPAEQNYQQQQQQHQQSRQPQTQQRQPQLRPPQQQQQQQQPQHQQPTRRTQPQSPLAQASNIHVQPNRQRQEVVLQADDPNAHRNDLKNEQLPHTNSATEQSPVWSNK